MKTLLAFALLLSGTSALAETLCGYVENPTPANFWLVDARATWIISAQGGYQAKGEFPSQENDKEMVLTNGYYGYFCACIKADVDASKKLVRRIYSSSAKKLSACLKDNALPQDFRPRTLIHSNGKAFTECQDENEEQIGFLGRQACVNKKGEYYFLAD